MIALSFEPSGGACPIKVVVEMPFNRYTDYSVVLNISPSSLFPICFHSNRTEPYELNRGQTSRLVFLEFSLIELVPEPAGCFS